MRLTCLLTFVAALCTASSPAPAAEFQPPNILILLADDLGYQDLGVQGSPDIKTPHIDSIAAGGVRCISGYVSSCMCSPSRAGLLTGRSQSRFGHEINWTEDPENKKGLPVGEKTFADRMRAIGYHTGIVGKWHLGEAPQFHPKQRGFDEFFGFLGGSHGYFDAIDPPKANRGPLEKDGKPFLFKNGYLTEVLGKGSAEFIHNNRQRPWFLYAAFNSPHVPTQATDKYLSRFPSIKDEMRRTYCAKVSALDDAVGVILQQLRDDQLQDNTLVVFLSDNGGPLERNGSSNDPLSGEKGGMLEGGIRVPFFVQWHGVLPEGAVYDRPVSSLDLLPTALAAARQSPPEDAKLDGVNLVPYLSGQKAGDPHAILYWRMKARNIWAVRAGDDKLVMQKSKGNKHPGGNEPRLIHLKEDPKEKQDRAADDTARTAELQALYDNWEKTLPEPLWGADKGSNE